MRRRVRVWNTKTKRYHLRKPHPGGRGHRKNPAFDDKALQKALSSQILDAAAGLEAAAALLNLPKEQRFPAAALFRMFTEFLAEANKRREKEKKGKK